MAYALKSLSIFFLVSYSMNKQKESTGFSYSSGSQNVVLGLST